MGVAASGCGWASSPFAPGASAWSPAVESFVREAGPRSYGRSQRRALEVVLAAYRPIALGEPVAAP
jgi:hypothetical protein